MTFKQFSDEYLNTPLYSCSEDATKAAELTWYYQQERMNAHGRAEYRRGWDDKRTESRKWFDIYFKAKLVLQQISDLELEGGRSQGSMIAYNFLKELEK